MIRHIVLKKAIPALLVGIAFLLVSCRAWVPIQKEPEEKVPPETAVKKAEEAPPREPDDTLFARGERYWQEGRLEEAQEAFLSFLDGAPEHEKRGTALHRLGQIYLKTYQYEAALNTLRHLRSQVPDDDALLPAVDMEIMEALIRLGDYQEAKAQGLLWIEKHPHHSLTADVQILVGRASIALGERAEAFGWWLNGWQTLKGQAGEDDSRALELRKRLEGLIRACRLGELEQIQPLAEHTDFAPHVFDAMARLYLEAGDHEKARTAAMALVRSTPEQVWVSRGKALLDAVSEEMSFEQSVMGCLLPLSGRFSIYGEEVLRGIQLGMGVFGGSPEPGEPDDLELIIRDTEGDADRTVSQLEDLVASEKVAVVIGPLVSKAAVAAARVAQQSGVPIVTLTQKEGITQEGGMVFRNFLTPSKEIERLMDPPVVDRGLKRFAILYPENAYGRHMMNLFWDRVETLGGVVTAVESYALDETDFAEQIKKMTGLFYPRPPSVIRRLQEERLPEEEESEIRPEEPEPIVDFDAVFIPDGYQRIAMIAPQLAYHDVLHVQLLGTSLWQSPKLVELAGDYVQGAIFTSGFFGEADRPEVKSFRDAYTSQFDTEPGILAASGYDTACFLKEVIGARNGRFRTRKALRDAMALWTHFDGVTGQICFDSYGEVQKKPLLLTVRGKRVRVLP